MNSSKTPRTVALRNAVMLGGVVLATFVALRLWLWFTPNADFDVAGHNVHHLFTGLIFITLGGIPLAIFRGSTRRLDVARGLFGIGLGLAIDVGPVKQDDRTLRRFCLERLDLSLNFLQFDDPFASLALDRHQAAGDLAAGQLLAGQRRCTFAPLAVHKQARISSFPANAQ